MGFTLAEISSPGLQRFTEMYKSVVNVCLAPCSVCFDLLLFFLEKSFGSTKILLSQHVGDWCSVASVLCHSGVVHAPFVFFLIEAVGIYLCGFIYSS